LLGDRRSEIDVAAVGADLSPTAVDLDPYLVPRAVVLSVARVVAENILLPELFEDLHEHLLDLVDLIDFDNTTTALLDGLLEDSSRPTTS
jgi:hypothetical protein